MRVPAIPYRKADEPEEEQHLDLAVIGIIGSVMVVGAAVWGLAFAKVFELCGLY